MKATFGLKWRWIALAIATPPVLFVLLFVLVQIKIHDHGPSAEEAFQRYIKSPIPKSVTDLRMHYAPHMRGYWIYLAFRVDPNDLDSLFDVRQSIGPVRSTITDGVTEYPGWTNGFRTLDPDGFMDMMTKGSCYFQDAPEQTSSLARMIVISADHRKVYYYRFQD